MKLTKIWPHTIRQKILVFVIILITFLTIASYLIYANFTNLQKELGITVQTSQESMILLQNQVNELTQKNEELMSILTEEQKKNLDLEKIKKRNERKIDTLEKLTTLDPELLKKYSKVFFLSENYTPPDLENIPTEFKITEDKDLKILKEVEPFLTDLLENAKDDGINLRIISAYRSFEEQKSLKSNYTFNYGSGANTFSADQGYSEHQLGTTIDFGTPEITGAYMSFEKTDAFTWLQNNAYKYGFILSYPRGNSYYQYEPWHWRFVGRELAEDLYDDGKNFYELDQRDIDEYLIEIFD
jgi:LAS superfamily LD-carboxypeptidase LdcB